MIIFLLLFASFNNPAQCIDLILKGDYYKAKQVYHTLKQNNDSDQMKFLNAYFTKVSEKALPVYRMLYANTSNRNIKYLSAKKLYEYTYANGLYQTSINYENAMRSLKTSGKSQPMIKQEYVIQCGVFTAESNAIALKEKLSSVVKNNVYLQATLIEGKNLIRVLIGNFNSIQDAEAVQQTIQQKFLLSTMIRLKNR